jgi:hypothetical protein
VKSNSVHIGMYVLLDSLWCWKCVLVRSHDFGEGKWGGGTYVASCRNVICVRLSGFGWGI